MSSDKEATSEQLSSVHEGTSYNKDLTWSPKRDLFAHSPAEEEEECEDDEEGEEKDNVDREEEEEEEGEEGEEEEGDDEGHEERVSQADSDGPRPFILPLIWTVNDFYPTMSLNVFKKLCDRFQILENIPIHLPRKFERCYLGKTTDVGMYDAMFAMGLMLPLTELHHQLANYLGLSISQITPNA